MLALGRVGLIPVLGPAAALRKIRFMTTALFRALLMLLLLFGISRPAIACNIVYGSNWAFVSEPPVGWDSACGDQSMEGTSLTLWPTKQGPSKASAYIYVTVSDKDPVGLKAFAEQEQSKFKELSPELQVSALPTSPRTDKHAYVLVRLKNASGNREEIAAYLDGPTAYYILVLTADSTATLANYKSAFIKYVADFIPMVRK
jgi:hypothetical protein